jgi:hypothetical protein
MYNFNIRIFFLKEFNQKSSVTLIWKPLTAKKTGIVKIFAVFFVKPIVKSFIIMHL